MTEKDEDQADDGGYEEKVRKILPVNVLRSAMLLWHNEISDDYVNMLNCRINYYVNLTLFQWYCVSSDKVRQ